MGNVLAPFKKFLSNKNTITILGVLLGVVVLYLGYNLRVNQAISPKTVLYASKTLVQGDTITNDVIGETSLSKKVLDTLPNVITKKDNLINKLVSYDCKIPEGSYFFDTCIIDAEEMPDSVFSNIPDGYTIFSLEVDNHKTMGNSIFPNDSIDLYMKTEDEEGKIIYGKFIKSIKVLTVKDGDGNYVFKNRDDVGEPKELLFSVPEDLYLLLSKAIYLGKIDIVPVPRNASYSTSPTDTEVESEYLKNIIISQTVTIPDENIQTVLPNSTENKTEE